MSDVEVSGRKTTIEYSTWTNCYSQGWPKELLVESAWSHPAKFSYKLIERIYAHAREEGWLPPGSVVLDPFAGVALGALEALRLGCAWIGCELEPKFFLTAQTNIAQWIHEYRHLPNFGPWAMVVNGDSRRLLEHMPAQHSCAISSPPFHDSLSNKPSASILNGSGGRMGMSCTSEETYGTTPGQLANMALSSPPYAGAGEVLGNHNGIDWSKTTDGGKQATPGRMMQPYGTSEGQLGAMVVSSPPYADGCGHTGGRDLHPEHVQGGEVRHVAYGASAGQLTEELPDNFWSAARAVVEQTYQLLKSGGIAMWVVKSYVRDKAIVDFPGQWQALCESVGFVTLHIHHAMLVEDHGTQEGLFGEATTTVYQTHRKSFFRRLAEKRGSPAINYEVVLCMIKPAGEGGGATCVMSSPPYAAGGTHQREQTPDSDELRDWRTDKSGGRMGISQASGYGISPGQLGGMPMGNLGNMPAPPCLHLGTVPVDGERVCWRCGEILGALED